MAVHTGKLGDDLTLEIPKTFASELGWEPNSPVDISLYGSAIIVCRAKQPRPALADLMDLVTEQNRHTETDTGEAVGREVW